MHWFGIVALSVLLAVAVLGFAKITETPVVRCVDGKVYKQIEGDVYAPVDVECVVIK